MGQCCSFMGKFIPLRSALEMGSTEDELLSGETMPQVHSMDVDMSAPTITIGGEIKNEVNGYGLALAEVSAEPDRAYWEWRVKVPNPPATLMFGVSNKRNAKFYEIMAESTVPPETQGTKFMCAVPNLNDGDVVGVAMQQSELPMIQLYLNGEVCDAQVSRFRGTVYPSVYVPQCDAGSISATFLYRDDQFIHGPPSEGFETLIAERSLM